MTKIECQPGDSMFQFQFWDAGKLLFTIKADGTLEFGPAFTTTDEMSLKFWEAVENTRRNLLEEEF